MRIPTTIKYICFLYLLVLGVAAKGQTPYGNEWIKYEQTYHKLKVTNTGLHKLSYGYLDSLGLSTANPQNLQLIRRGKEVAIFVAGEQDGRLDAQDYLEFYGERNDGALDRELYKDPTHQHHQFFSLYSDTASYFLTVAPVKGKRMQQKNIAANGLAPETYFIRKALSIRSSAFYSEKNYGTISKMPWMDQGEGYVSDRRIGIIDYPITGITNVNTSGPAPVLEYLTTGQYRETHKLDVNLITPAGAVQKLGSYNYGEYETARDVKKITFADIRSNGSVVIQVAPEVTATRGNAISLAYAQVTYPQSINFGSNHLVFFTDSLKTGNYNYELTNVPASIVAYDISDPINVVRIQGNTITNGKSFVVEGSNRSRKILLADTSKPLKPVRRDKDIRFRKITPDAHNYIILTNKRLMKKALGSELRAPEQYAAYRASQAGGGYDTLLTHMDQIVDQFHYGEFSSNAIRRFMRFMSSSPRAKQLYIIGKGVKYASAEYVTTYGGKFSYYHVGGRHPKVHELDLVPTGITPSSDIFFTADFHNDSYTPAVPTGRLAATRPEDIINYLNKVKEYEAVPEGLAWRKNILQLGGGSSVYQINQIANYLKNYKSIAEGPLLGATVIEKYRQNVSEVVESINVAAEINNGISLMTFYGHSSPGTTDLDIGMVSSPLNGYNNKGKYPVILMNGCNTGDAFIPNNRSFGEDWINTPDKGAVAFIAHSDAGEVSYLNLYSTNFYLTAFQDPEFYGKPLGEVQKQTIQRVLQSSSSGIVIAMAMEMMLQGDPAVTLYSPSKPDYVALENEADVYSNIPGEVLTTASEKYNITLGIQNLGKALPDSVTVSVKRILADKTELAAELIRVAPVLNKNKVVLEMDNKGIAALGMNTFEVTVDGDFKFDELDEMNNTARFQHYFPANGLVAVTPAKYSVVNTENVKIAVQTTILDESRQGFYLEVDTTNHFKSNLKQAFTAPNSILPTWDVNVASLGNLPDSTVYYWRARFQHYEFGEDTLYASGSFRVIKESKGGWSQSHIGQFTSIETNKVNLTERKPYFNFLPGVADISIKTRGGEGGQRYTNPPYGIFLNDKHLLGVPCDYPESSTLSRLYMVVINDKTLELVRGLPFAMNCLGTEYDYLYQFRDMTNATTRANVEAFLKQVPEGYYVAVISINNVPFKSFTQSQKDAFKLIGAEYFEKLENGHPYALLGRKGAAPGTVYEELADPNAPSPGKQEIILRVTLKSNQQAGEITSPVIGPALSWGTLHHNIEKYKAGNDDYTLRVIGIDTEGNPKTLVEDVNSKSFDLSNIDAKVYPNLRLQASLSDATDRSAPQLKQWVVFYEAAPEGVIRPDLVQVSEAILTEQANKGKITLPMVFQNITPFTFRDSLAVDVTVTGDGLQQPIQKRLKLAPLAGNANATFNYELNTLALDGNYRVSIYVNPRLQPEQIYANNIFVVPFKVKSKLHPIMDVAFDGVHIMDGELISPSPMISVTVKDENRYAYLEDASGMSVVLVDELGVEKELSLNETSDVIDHLEVYPATEKSDFKVEFKPKALANGRYKMEIRAKDVAGKPSGISPYSINFEVENESTITNFYPFPNPFSTKTNFIFTLTGSIIPDHIKIQILTITGKVVKEIMKEELGPLRIGNNKTEYAWDGTDMYGDKLANGVYLYRVVVSRSDEMMYHKQKYGDKAFKNGYGKLYILR
ncbi:C25 family cysteine peptidase [Pontibacter sp. H259]|uniref:putative type IX secretion system sortase PorU2 n=1 Tax=Pontibacter sp. H259 TaxID=3133421 RepID=UPI0030BC575F